MATLGRFLREPVGAATVGFSAVMLATIGVVEYFDSSLVPVLFAVFFALLGIAYVVAFAYLRRATRRRERAQSGM